MNSAWNVEDLDEDALYCIFDDIPFEKFMTWQAFFGAFYLSFPYFNLLYPN